MHVSSMQECWGIKFLSGQKCRSRHTTIDVGVLCCHYLNEFMEIKITHVTDAIFVYINLIGNSFQNIVLPMINWKAGIYLMLLSAASVLHNYLVSDILLTSDINTWTVVSNIMLEWSKSVMIGMLKYPEEIKLLIFDFSQIWNCSLRHMWLFEWLILNKHLVLKMVKLACFFV